MTEPQVWTVIGVLAAALVGMITLVTQLMMRALSSQIAGVSEQLASTRAMLDLKIDHLREGVNDRLDRVDGRLDGMEVRLDGLERRFDSLDRDVQAIARKVFPTEPS